MKISALFSGSGAYNNRMKLALLEKKFHTVRKGQTLREIAWAYGCPQSILVKENGLTEEVKEGQVLRLPENRCHLYRVRGGESKTLLCGSKESYEKRNGTAVFYPEQTVWL